MEILKFDESGASSPSRKRSGRGAILVTFVALVFGAGTALASGTLTINEGDDIELAQGVTQTTQCDANVNISLETALVFDNPNPSKFYLKKINVSRISDQCLGKTLRLKVYDADGDIRAICQNTDPGCAGGGTYIDGLPLEVAETTEENTLSLTLSEILEIRTAADAKNVTIETIS
jgi:hypothetical protein